ncbi:MAG: NADH-quinone oxidoreductase subunit I [Puniceicoccaceae bacterium TMED149]|jgi:NADH-quinone oxidoreductase subunit A|nr:MAG: NADH-quinone oxidoreductase subunit I [Puniceicoccaceae bacterium TMED149]|tara:strand:- start:11820 stop:12194 length:375 start_codon:yes stop_codon:yes gene_type:complete
MSLGEYYPILVQIALALGIGVIILVASHIFGQRSKSTDLKDSAYECGMLAEGSGHARFAVKFYVTAMLFILFDLEVVFLIPWILIFRDFMVANISILVPMLFFLFVLIFGLVYELKKGALEWEK